MQDIHECSNLESKINNTHFFTESSSIVKSVLYGESEYSKIDRKCLENKLLLYAASDLLKRKVHNVEGLIRGCFPPRIVTINGLYLSLSHTIDYACATASFRPVGIDCEKIRPFSDYFIKKFTTYEEASVFDVIDDVTLTKIWCCKEAVSKAMGKGLNMDFRVINIYIEKDRLFAGIIKDSMDRTYKFSINLYILGDIVMALADSISAGVDIYEYRRHI